MLDSGERVLNLAFTEWDSRENVLHNRKVFQSAANASGLTFVPLKQFHSSVVRFVARSTAAPYKADASFTNLPRLLLGVQTADCVPMLLVDPKRRAVAAIHAGWRGTLARIAAKTIAKMRESLGCDPARLLIAVGPGIRSCCFEVGPEVLRAFQTEFAGVQLGQTSASGRLRLDLRRALEIQFEEAGASSERVYDLGKCTRCCADEFFSFRREGPRSGRLMGVIGLV